MKNEPGGLIKPYRSILWKWWFSSLFLVLLTLTLIGWLTSDLLESYSLSRIKDDLVPEAVAIGTLLTPLIEKESSDNSLPEAVEKLGDQTHNRITVIRSDGVVLADSYEKRDAVKRMDNHLHRPEIQEALVKGSGSSVRFSDTVKRPMLYFALPLKHDDRLAGFIRLAVPLSDLSQPLRRMKQLLLLVFLAVFGASILIAYFFSKRLTWPLQEIMETARVFGKGDLTQRIRVRTGDEIEAVSEIFNQMADEISLRLEEVSKERSQLSAVLNGMMEGIMILDSRGMVLLTNPSLNQMFSLQAPIKKDIYYFELIRHHEMNEWIRRVLTERKNLALDLAISHPRESFFLLQASIASGKNNENDFYAVLVFHEITEIRRLERIRKDFVANVSHELKTPLTSIKGYLEALSELEAEFPEKGKQFISVLQKQSERMENIVSDLLQLAKIESGQEKLQISPIHLKPFFEKMISALASLARKKNQTLDYEVSPDLVLEADPDKLSRILINLLENAIKYTPDNGKVFLGANGRDGWIEISVRDNGIGIPPSEQGRIFERFYRVDRARSRELGGTGLGLSIVKHLVEAHGGSISVESYPNEGSTFTARFPSGRP